MNDCDWLNEIETLVNRLKVASSRYIEQTREFKVECDHIADQLLKYSDCVNNPEYDEMVSSIRNVDKVVDVDFSKN